MNAAQLIVTLRNRRLIPEFLAEELRALGEAGELSADPVALLERLVAKGMLTQEQSDELQNTVLLEQPEEELINLVPVDDVDLTPVLPLGGSRNAPPSSAEPASLPKSKKSRRRREDEEDQPISLPLDALDDVNRSVIPVSGAVVNEIAATTALKNLGGGTKDRRKSAKSRRNHAWDSPLLLYGGATLLLLAGVGGLLYYLLFRESADAVLAKAKTLSDAGQYQLAEAEYEHFIEHFSGHSDYSLAKVRMGMTRLWRAVEGSDDYAGALKVAQQVIPQIEEEPAFVSGGAGEGGLSQSKQELSTLLTRIATGLAEQAESATDDALVAERVDELHTVLGLTSNTKYVPERYRLDSDLDKVQATLERVAQGREREVKLSEALKAMDAAIAAGDPGKAFEIRRELLRKFPVLTGNDRLDAKLREAGQAEQKLVKFVASEAKAVTTAAASPIVAELTLADRQGPAPGAGIAEPVVVSVDGSLYGLRADSGNLLWRRRVGGKVAPLVLADGDVIAADSDVHELVRLAGATGKLVWRLALDDELATPTLAGNRLLVAARSGKLYVVDTASGNSTGYVQFSQPLGTPPCLNDRGDRIYVVGERSNLYTLSAEDFSCLGVYALGHAPGGVMAPPIYAVNKVIVADNVGVGTSQIHALSIDDRSVVTAEAAMRRLSGLVSTPLAVAGRRIAVVTSLGQAGVIEVATGQNEGALSLVASREAEAKEHLARFALLQGGNLWIAGDSLAKLEILPTENKLATRSLDRDFHGDAFDAPLQSVAGKIVAVRRPAGIAGAVILAIGADGDRVAWETAVAIPAAGSPAADPGGMRLAVATAAGTVHVLDRGALGRRISDEALHALALPPGFPPFAAAVDVGRGRLAIGGEKSPSALLLRPDELRQPLSVVPLPGPLACPVVAWRGGFVAATRAGQVFLFDADSGNEAAAPFQPALTPGREYDWLTPAVSGDGADSHLAISDGVDKVYLVGVDDAPTPHLAIAASVDVGPATLVTQLAATKERVFAGAETEELASYSLPKLERQKPTPMGGLATWGPFAAGDGVLLATDADELLFVGDDGGICWRTPLGHGDLSGSPLVDGEAVLVLARSGGVARVSLADGKETAYLDLKQPVALGPVAFGNRLVLAAADGSLLVVNRPE